MVKSSMDCERPRTIKSKDNFTIHKGVRLAFRFKSGDVDFENWSERILFT